jgi:hypothetical protein
VRRTLAWTSALLFGAYAFPAAAQSPPAAPTTIALGDWQLAPTLELRTRGEYRHDPPDLGGLDEYGRASRRVRDAWNVAERARIGLGAERGAVRAQLTIQDARAFGAPTPSATFMSDRGLGQIAPYEAFAEMHGSGTRPLYFRLGRQAVVWGEGRLIGTADFSPVGRSLDAARAHVAAGNFDFEALAAILEMPSPLGRAFNDTAGPSRSGTQLYGLLARWTLDPLLRLEAFALMRMSRSSGANLDGSRFQLARLSGETYTGALRVSGDAKGWTYGLEGAYQFGTADALGAGGVDVGAWALAAHVAKQLDSVALTPTLRVAGSYASGDDNSGTYKQFDPLLADPQRFHGQMDLFSWSNEMDVSGRVSIIPWTDTTFGIEYRWARLAESTGEWIGSYLTSIGSVRAAPGAKPPPIGSGQTLELGHELDVVFAWRPWLPLELRVGWSGLLLGDAAKAIMSARLRGNGEDDGTNKAPSSSQYAYAQATLNVP